MRNLRALVAALVIFGLLAQNARAVEMLTPKTLVAKGQATSWRGVYEAGWIPGTHKLIYSSMIARQGCPCMYLLDLDSGRSTYLGQGEGPHVSYDGKWIAFVREFFNSSGSEIDQLWVSRIDGSNQLEVSKDLGDYEPQTFAWSPSSDSLAFAVFVVLPEPATASNTTTAVVFPEVSAYYRLDVHLFNASTNVARLVYTRPAIDPTDLSWLGDRYLILDHDNAQQEILRGILAQVDLATGKDVKVISIDQRQPVYSPAVSSRGDMVGYIGGKGSCTTNIDPLCRDLVIHSFVNGSTRYMTHNQEITDQAWTPDERWILIVNGPSTHHELYAMDVATGKIVELTNDQGYMISPVISSDGRFVAWQYRDANDRYVLRVANWKDGRLTKVRSIATLTDPTAGVQDGKSVAITWQSPDGTLVDGYLTYPVGYSPGRRYPLILLIHGGPGHGISPSEGDWPGGILFKEYFAERGYAIFTPDYRMSGMLGFDKVDAARRAHNIHQADFQDLMSGVSYLVHRHIADPKHLYVLGHSNGSFETNWIITHDHQFRAAVTYEGSDFLWEWGNRYDYNLGWWFGDKTPLQQFDWYLAESDIPAAKNITIPTLFIAGGSSGTKMSMEWLYAASQARHVDSRYVVYEHEGHVVSRPANQVDLVNRVTDWIKSHS